MLIDSHGWLTRSDDANPTVVHVPTRRTTTLDGAAPLGVCWHWTAGDYGVDRGHQDSVDLARWIAEGSGPSWHVLIDKDGAVIVSASAFVGTNHVGKVGDIGGRRLAVNRNLIGIELENAGELVRVGGHFYAWPVWKADAKGVASRALGPDPRYRVDAGRAVNDCEQVFDAFTDAQEWSAELVVRALVARFGFTRADLSYGHVDFDAPRKMDPGPVWRLEVLPRILDRVFPAA